MNIRKAFEDFMTAHKVANASKHTLVNYRHALTHFIDWIESTYNINDTDDLRLSHLRDWLIYLQSIVCRTGKPFDVSTVRQYGIRLTIFCHWLESEEVIEKAITTRFKLPKEETKFIPTFTPDDVQRMLDACEEGEHLRPALRKALTARNRAILSVLIDAGIRRSELVNLRLCDVDRDLRVLVVHRKGNKWQQVPISREGFKPLHEYLTKHRAVLAAVAGRTVAFKEDAVFLSKVGNALTIIGVNKLFERIASRTGIDGKKVSPHNCRRYMATSQLAMGRSPLDVQRQMGHTTLHMTNKYASLSVEQLQKSHEEYSPLRQRPSDGKIEPKGAGYWDE